MKNQQVSRKIKTITCHDVYNFGASLQAYALMKYLQNLGHQVEIIDYKPNYLTYNLWAIGKKWKRNFILRILFYSYVIPRRLSLKSRRQKFDAFTKSKMAITPRRYHSNEDLKIEPPLAEIYFAGSDQIWNTSHSNGKDPAFYLDFVPVNSVKASYAASFSISKIPKDQTPFVKSSLKKFDAISVREESGLKILQSLDIQGGLVVVDPVFLLEMESWAHLSSFTPTEKYILIYDQENNTIIRNTAKKLADAMKLKIYAIQSLYPMSYAHRKLKNVGPQEFLGLIKHCELCLTNSFHGTAFSLIFQKEFYTFKRTHERVNSRMIDLLEMLQIKERLIEDFKDIRDYRKINYQNINRIINNKLRSSEDYIDRVINIKKGNG